MKIVSFLSKPFWNINKQTSWEEKCCLLFSNISFRSRDIQVFKICNLAKWWNHTLKHILFKYDAKDILANLYQKCLTLCSTILLNVLFNTSLTVLLPWQQTEFQTSPILNYFLASIGVPFWYLLTALHMDDPASV